MGYDAVSEYDQKCGTFGLDSFKLPNGQCPEHFVCGGADGGVDATFGDCIDSMNCAMLDGMTTMYGGDATNEMTNDAILFMRQMIPPHQNAVNMAKAAMKLGGIECGGSGIVEEGTDLTTGCVLDPIVRGIINTQNKQIQTMKGILATFGVKEISDCDVPDASTSAPGGGDKGDDKKDDKKDSGANGIFGGTMAALAVGVAALL